MRAVRPGARRPDRPAPPDRLRRAAAFRARHRSGAAARGAGGRHAPDPATLCGGEASEVVPGRRRAGIGSATASLRFARLASFGGSGSCRRTRRSAALERLGFTVLARDAEQVHGERAVLAQRHRPAAPRSTRRRTSTQRRRRRRRAAAQIEPEVDLIEEVLRLQRAGCDRRRSRCRVAAAVPPPTLTPRTGAHGAGAAGAGGARPGRSASPSASSTIETAALFGDTPDGAAAGQPDRRRSGPDAPDAGRDRWRWPPRATSRAAVPDLGAVRDRPGLPRRYLPQQPLVAAGLRVGKTPRSSIAPARPYDAMDAKADVLAVLAALGVPMEALSVTADAPGFYHPGQSGVRAAGAEDGAGARSARCIRACWRHSTCRPGRSRSRCSSTRSPSRSAAAGRRRTCPPSSRCAATSPSWSTAACRPKRCCVPRVAPSATLIASVVAVRRL